jgi:transposase
MSATRNGTSSRPYLALLRTNAPQRRHDVREVFDGLCWLVRTGAE